MIWNALVIVTVLLPLAGLAIPTPIPTPPVTPEPPADPDTLTFNQRVRRAIGQAVARLADLVEPILQADKTPFLIGPTDVAKTSAIRLVAVRRGWAFEALDGMSSFADADLVGLKTDHGVYASVIARAFRRARSGECVLLFLDELTRLNQRAMDVLMRPLLPIPAEVAWAQRVPADDGQAVRTPALAPKRSAGASVVEAILEAAATFSMSEASSVAEGWQRRLAGGVHTDSAEAIRRGRER